MINEQLERFANSVKSGGERIDFITAELPSGGNIKNRPNVHPALYELSTRARHGLNHCNVRMVCDIEDITTHELRCTTNVGVKTFKEITAWMEKYKLRFKDGQSR
jgi:DNA-directed RNA polymerase alpha subunit